MVDPVWGHVTITVTDQPAMCDEELIAMTMHMRQLAYVDDTLAENYVLLREVCWQQTGVDSAVLGHHMDRLTNTVRTD